VHSMLDLRSQLAAGLELPNRLSCHNLLLSMYEPVIHFVNIVLASLIDVEPDEIRLRRSALSGDGELPAVRRLGDS
jgi:hypothetical protein